MLPDLSTLSDEQLQNLSTVADTASANGVDPNLAIAQTWQESHGASNATSKAGATGPMQLMPATAADLGVDPTNPQQNIQGGVKYDKQMLAKYNDPTTALMAYNWGPGNVDNWIENGSDITKVPTETLNYVNNIMGNQPAAPSSATPNLQSMSTADLQALLEKVEPQDHSGLSNTIGSTANSIGAGLANMPGAKQIGAGVASIVNGTPYSQELQQAKNAQQEAKAANPITYGTANVIGQALPFAAAGASIPLNALAGGAEALSDGGSAKDVAGSAALSAALPYGLGKVAQGANVIGNVARGVGDMPGSTLWKMTGLATPAEKTAGNINKLIGEQSAISKVADSVNANQGWDYTGNSFMDKVAADIKNRANNSLTRENPLIVAKQILSQGGSASDALQYLSSNNPAWYGSVGKSLWEPTKELGEVAATALSGAHPLSSAMIVTNAGQYGGALVSKIMSDPNLSSVVKEQLIARINQQNGNP